MAGQRDRHIYAVGHVICPASTQTVHKLNINASHKH